MKGIAATSQRKIATVTASVEINDQTHGER
jgi:hypothetical protein